MTLSSKNRSLVVALLSVLFLLATSTHAFSHPSPQLRRSSSSSCCCRPRRIIPSTSSSSTTTRRTSLFLARDTKEGYNDDAFGLVFLCGAFAAQDVVFSTVYLTLSALAALATQQDKLPANTQVPAAVAGVTLLLTPTLTTLLVVLGGGLHLPEAGNPSASALEVGLCVASMAYGFVLSSSNKE
jgi:hypothetical protein